VVTPCAGGQAQPAPGVNRNVVIGAAAAEAILDVISEGAAVALAPIIAGVTYDLTQVCAEDPPADPGLTAQDVIDATNFVDPTVSIPAIEKAREWFLHYYWYTVCKCVSGATPDAPTPSNPGNTTSLNPGLPGGPAQECSDLAVTIPAQVTIDNGTVTTPFYDAQGMFPSGAAVSLPSFDTRFSSWPGRAIPPGTTSYTVTITGQGPNWPFQSVWLRIALWDTNHTSLISSGVSTYAVTPGVPVTVTHTVPATAVYWSTVLTTIVSSGVAGLPQVNADIEFQTHCAGGAIQAQPCCPPDPSIDARFAQVLGLLNSIWTQVQGSADSLKPGATHANLSGAGSILLQAECAAIQVNVHSPLPPLEVNPGSPDYYFSMGFITSYAIGSPLKGWRLVYTQQIFPVQTYADQIGYTLPAGVTIDIIEQLPATALG
jgi:hypothetical protein